MKSVILDVLRFVRMAIILYVGFWNAFLYMRTSGGGTGRRSIAVIAWW